MFSKNLRYALKALAYLANRAPGSCRTEEVAGAAGCPLASLAKVLQALNRAGIVKTQRGVGGGVCLTRKPARLTIREVVDAVSPPERSTCFPHDASIVSGRDCPLGRRLAHIETLITRVLQETTLAEFVTKADGSPAGHRRSLDDELTQIPGHSAISPRLHIVGRKNSGKTTLIVDLVGQLSARGLRVGTIKHTHHRHELDTPGKDSFRHRQAGAVVVGILSPAMDAVFVPQDSVDERTSRYLRMSAFFAECDLVLVEGDQQADWLKIEVWRKEVCENPLAMADKSILALVTDDKVPVKTSAPVWSRADVDQLSAEVLRLTDIGSTTS